MLASLAEGVTEIQGFLPGEDNLATAAMLKRMGIDIRWRDERRTQLSVFGRGLHGLSEPDDVLDAGNSGTCARLMLGILAGQSFFSVLNGDASLRRRPMGRVVGPIRRMGAQVDGRMEGDRLPLAVRGGKLQGITHRSAVASAQVKSCILLAGLYAAGETVVEEPQPSRDHTERMLPVFGQPVERDGRRIRLVPTEQLVAPTQPLVIPSDPSSASFLAVAASIVPSSDIRLIDVGVNPRRDGWRRLLEQMGAAITVERPRDFSGEPVADLHVKSSRLHNVAVSPDIVPDAIDEFPILCVAAATASGEFVLRGASELRVKESDRIAVMVEALRRCGVDAKELEDGLIIRGGQPIRGGITVDARDDHRIAMAIAVLAQVADRDIRIERAQAIATSFPEFVDMGTSLGMNVRWADD